MEQNVAKELEDLRIQVRILSTFCGQAMALLAADSFTKTEQLDHLITRFDAMLPERNGQEVMARVRSSADKMMGAARALRRPTH